MNLPILFLHLTVVKIKAASLGSRNVFFSKPTLPHIILKYRHGVDDLSDMYVTISDSTLIIDQPHAAYRLAVRKEECMT